MADEKNVIIKLDNGNTQHYRMVENTGFEVQLDLKSGEIEDYSGTVNDRLINVILRYINNRKRVRVWYGDTKTGRSWNEEYDVTGYIGRSGGSLHVPLLVNNSRSFGGGALSVGCIIRIDDIESHSTVWKVDNFHVEEMKLVYKEGEKYPYMVMQKKDGEADFTHNIANFKSEKSALRYMQFMTGERYNK